MKKGLLLLLFMLTFIFISSNLAAQEPVQIISKIEFEGNQIIQNEELLTLVSQEVGQILNTSSIQADMQKIYDSGYFRDVTVSFQPYNGGVKVIFHLIEYPRVKEIVINGNNVYSDDYFLSKLDVEKKRILNYADLTNSAQAIIKKYQEDGYVLAGFSDISISDDGVLTLEFNEGTINNVIIKGNNRTKDFVIKRELEFSEGDVLNKKDIQGSLQNLYRLKYFKEFNLDYSFNEDHTVDLILNVVEDKTALFEGGVTWSSVDGWIGYIDVKERNLMGNGQTLAFDWKFGGITNYQISLDDPGILGSDTSFDISVYDRNSSGTDKENGDYLRHRQGGYISLGRNLTDEWNGKLRLKIENGNIDWVENKDADIINVIRSEPSTLNSLTMILNRNTSNNFMNPSRGGLDHFSVEYAGQLLGGSSDFTKYNLDLRRYYPGFKEEQAWGVRVKAGSISGNAPEIEKFRLGGSYGLRGYDDGLFSGKDMLLFNVEYRIPVQEGITAVAFTDAGNAWEDNMNLGDLHYSIGAGVRLSTILGEIRLDYAFNEDGVGQPHFGLGHTF